MIKELSLRLQFSIHAKGREVHKLYQGSFPKSGVIPACPVRRGLRALFLFLILCTPRFLRGRSKKEKYQILEISLNNIAILKISIAQHVNINHQNYFYSMLGIN